MLLQIVVKLGLNNHIKYVGLWYFYFNSLQEFWCSCASHIFHTEFYYAVSLQFLYLMQSNYNDTVGHGEDNGKQWKSMWRIKRYDMKFSLKYSLNELWQSWYGRLFPVPGTTVEPHQEVCYRAGSHYTLVLWFISLI